MHVPFVDLVGQYRTIQADINAAIADVLARGDFILGQAVTEFETAFARYCEVEHAIGVDSGFSALELILRAYGIGPGDEVITSANTFIATALGISNCGARPVLVDVSPDTYNLDPQLVEAAITPATKAILPVHLYGQPADMDALAAIAKQHGLLLIEDACQAHGARYKGRRAGSLGHAAAFSFYPGKNLGAYGDGGAVTTSDPVIAERVKLLRNLGQRVKYHHEIKGYNRRLDTLQAAVLRVKLAHLDEWNDARRRVAAHYGAALADHVSGVPVIAPWAEHVFHLYVVRVHDREGLQRALQARGISTGIHYPIPIHLQPAFAELGYARGAFPVTEAMADEILSLPIFSELGADVVEQIVDVIAAHGRLITAG